MAEILFLIVGIVAGGLVVLFYRQGKTKAQETMVTELRSQVQQKGVEVEGLRLELAKEQQAKAGAEARLEEARKNLDEQKRLLTEAEKKLADTFKALSLDALTNNNQAFLDLAKKTLENFLTEAKGDLGKRQQAIEGVIKPLKESLDKYEKQLREIENARTDAYGGLRQQLEQLTQTHRSLEKETSNLVSALKRPQVRGRWGEITLRRVVEAAGMSQYCDFTEQPSVDTEDGRKRPDLIVKLPQGRTVIVDAKVPLSSYMSAVEAESEEARKAYMIQHSQTVREHMRLLGSKEYSKQFNPSPDFVVLFLPGESFFSAALEQDRDLIEDGIANRVILATPTTLIALLRTVAYSWQQQQLAENARKIAQAGTDLFERVCKFAEHLDGIRSSLDAAVKSYNEAVGSWEHRVIPGARRLKELGAASPEQELSDIEPIEKSLREIPDLTEEK